MLRQRWCTSDEINAGATWRTPDSETLLMTPKQTPHPPQESAHDSVLFSCHAHSTACDTEDTHTCEYMAHRHTIQDTPGGTHNTYTVSASYFVFMHAKAQSASSAMPAHRERRPDMHTRIHKILHNRIGKHIRASWRMLWFAGAVSVGRVWQHGGDTTLHGTVKLTSPGRRRMGGWKGGRQQSPNNKPRGGEIWGTLHRALANSGITFTPKSTGSISTGEHSWQLLVSYFFFSFWNREEPLTPPRTEHVTKLLKTQRAWTVKAFPTKQNRCSPTAFRQTPDTQISGTCHSSLRVSAQEVRGKWPTFE